MQQLRIFLITIGLTLMSVIYGQLDPLLCPNGPTTTPDPKWEPVPPRFEIMTEFITANEMMELSQAFSSELDAVIVNSNYGPIQLYWNFGTAEQFEVLNPIINQQPIQQCLRQVIQPLSETSVIIANSLILKPSVLLGFNPRNQVNTLWGNQYIGDEDVRGIPANKFTSCFYVSDIKATVSATYYASDITKFQAYLPQNTSIILQIDVNIRNQAGHSESYKYNVFRYTPNPTREEELQALNTPAGVYCANRTSTLDIPDDLPDRVSQNSETFSPLLNSSVVSAHGLYDTEFQLSRSDVWYSDPFGGPQWLHHTEIHDFATGLVYEYNTTTGQCIVRNISLGVSDAVMVDGKPNLVQMGSIQHLFLLDDTSYQYTGEKRCRDRVWCHVWIGEKLLANNISEQLEWYLASRVNDEFLTDWIPMKMIGKNYVNGALSLTYETTIFNFHRPPNISFGIDETMADCYRAMGPEENYNLSVISFTVANDQEYPVQKNIDYLRSKIWETLTSVLQMRPIRISNIIVDHDGKDLPVTFTLLDVPPSQGPVEVSLQEPSLTTAIERLRSVIDANGLSFRAKYGTTEVTLRARIKSLQVIYTNFDQNADQCANRTFVRIEKPDECPDTTTEQNLNQNSEIVYKSSGPLITGFWIGFIVLGILIGAVGGFFALKRCSGR